MGKETKIIETTIESLVPDDLNANKGNEYGNHLIEKSIREFGLGRSILIDKNNHIIAGNKTTENAGAVGIEKVRIIETDGTEIIAVKRTDIDLNTKAGRELALADNASSKANITWDNDVIEKLNTDFDIDTSGWGVYIEDITKLSESDLTEECKNKPAIMKITFESPEQLQKAEIDIQELIDRKYNGAFFSVSAGEL